MKTPAIWLMTAASFFSASAGEQEQKLTLQQLPAPAAKAIENLAAGAPLEKITKEEEDGKVSYEAEFKKDGHEREVSVDAEGKLVSEEQQIGLADVPEAVRKAIEAKATGGKIEKIERVTENGKTTFEAEITLDGKRMEFEIEGSGKVSEDHATDVDDDD